MLQLQLIGGHLFGPMNDVPVVKGPIVMKKPVLMRFINRRSRNKIHRLDENALDMVPDHKVRQLIAHSFFLVIRSQDEKSPDAESMAADISYGFFDFLCGTFLMVRLKRSVIDKFNPHIQFKKSRPFQKTEHFIVKSHLIAGLDIKAVPDFAINNRI